MDEAINAGLDFSTYDYKVKGCPVKLGDRFYYNNHGCKTGTICEDFIRVMEIKEMGSGEFAILGRYENHMFGPHERWYSSKIFEDPNWVIKRNGI